MPDRTSPLVVKRSVLALCTCLVIAGSCERDRWSAQRTALTGDEAVLSKFEGRWYELDRGLTAEVRIARPSYLAVRLPSEFRIANGRVHGEEIHFSLQWPGRAVELSLRLVAEDVLAIVRPGQEPSWCGTCTLYLQRLSTGELMILKAEHLGERIEVIYEGVMDWLIDVL